MISTDILMRAADMLATIDTPEQIGFAPEAIEGFLEDSGFKTHGELKLNLDPVSLAYGISVGIMAAGMVD